MLSSLMVDDAQAWINLGLCYRDAGFSRSAIRAFYKASRCAAHDPLPWKNLGDIYCKQGQLRYARKAYKTAIMLDPQDQGLHSSLKSCYPAAPTN
jgi:Flp pilus assembly protein TadD